MANYKNYDATFVSKHSNDNIQTLELLINYSTAQLQVGVEKKTLKGQCKIEVKESSLILLGYFDLEPFEACTNERDGEDASGKAKWKKESVTLDSEKACCIVIPKMSMGKEVADFSVFKIVLEKILSTSDGAKAFDVSIPLSSLYFNDYYKSELKLHEDAAFNDPEGDWKVLTVSSGTKPPRLKVAALSGEEAKKVLAIETPNISTGGKKGYNNYSESTTKKLESKLEFLQVNHKEVEELAQKMNVDKVILLQALMS